MDNPILRNHKLLIEADKINQLVVSNEFEFHKIAKQLAAQSLFIDEGNQIDRDFSIESLIKEYEFWHKYPFAILVHGFIFEDHPQYKKIWTKYYGYLDIHKFKQEYDHELVCDFLEILEKSGKFDIYEMERMKQWIITKDEDSLFKSFEDFPKFDFDQHTIIYQILCEIWNPTT